VAEDALPPCTMLRHHGGGHAPVSYLELFFDLVYVFAITQISHALLVNLTWRGLAEAGTAFLGVWWAWMYTTWAANWANPDRAPVRIMLLLAMLASLLMATALPHAFSTGPADCGALFAGSYLALQFGRTLFMAAIMRQDDRRGMMNMLRIACWFVLSSVFWLAGLRAEGDARIALWLTALGIEYLGPLAGFRTPFLGRSMTADWNISGSHMAERCALFIIIALGEGIVVTGANLAAADLTAERITAFLTAFAGSALMWWIYFDLGAERGARHITTHAEPGRVAREAYTYLHMPIVGSIIVCAVADALLLEGHEPHASRELILTTCGGLVTFLVGLGLFKRFSNALGNFPLSHNVGIGLLLALGGWAWWHPLPATGFAAGGVMALGVVAVWEWGSYHGGWRERLVRLWFGSSPESA
jgi:low temperature requirement protein LtrA